MEHDDYLWDKTGTPDPELEGWERALGRFSSKDAARELKLASLVSRPRKLWPYWLAAAASLLIGAGVQLRVQWQPGAQWKVEAIAGSPMIDGRALGDSLGRLAAGGMVETDARSRAKVHMGLMGTIEVAPNSRVRLVATRGGRHRVALESGMMAARLWAPPATLTVETASATAIDLGCAFVVQVDEGGSGILRVTSGWVQFQLGEERKVVVPAGAAALTRPQLGPGTPFFEDASDAMRAALERLDFEGDATSLEIVLSEARSKDTFTLLSLLPRLGPGERGLVYDRAAGFIRPPDGYTREDAMNRTNQAGIDEWWRRLGLGDAKNWLVNWRDVFGAGR